MVKSVVKWGFSAMLLCSVAFYKYIYYENNIVPAKATTSPLVNNLKINNRIARDTRINDYLKEWHPDVDYDARFYLKAAHIATLNYFNKGYSDDIEDKSDTIQVLRNKVADCSIMSRYTYNDFVYLLQKTGNLRLLDDVRIVSGYSNGKDGWRPHQWLELRISDNWIIYETTRFMKPDKDFQAFGLVLDAYDTAFLAHDYSRDYYPLTRIRLDRELKFEKDIDWLNVLTNTHLWK